MTKVSRPKKILTTTLEFCENRLSSNFCVILLTNKLTNKQTNADETITLLAEVMFRKLRRLRLSSRLCGLPAGGVDVHAELTDSK